MNRLLILMFLAGMTFNCGGEQSDAPAEETTETSTEAESAASKSADVVLNPNLASKEELMALKGVNEALAQQIIDGRPFLGMRDFYVLVASTIGESEMESFLATCFVPLNLNTATEEEFKMVPGVGDKMAHEFEEYRPYKKVAQFRREMGKYVDEAEIARYENYVFVPIELNSATDEEILAIPGVGDRMLHEFKEYRPYTNMQQFIREIGKYVDDKELERLEYYVYLGE